MYWKKLKTYLEVLWNKAFKGLEKSVAPLRSRIGKFWVLQR